VCPSGPVARDRGAKDEAGLAYFCFEDPVFRVCFKHHEV